MKRLPVLAVAVLLVFSFEVSANTFTVSGGGFDGIVGAKQFQDGNYDVSVAANRKKSRRRLDQCPPHNTAGSGWQCDNRERS